MIKILNKKIILRYSHINAYSDFDRRALIGGDYIKQKSNKTKYCTSCARVVEREKTRKRVEKHRNKNKM